MASLSYKESVLALGFSQTVKVKRTVVDRFSFLTSLNLLGSNLGLWPGMGIFQVLEWIVGTLAGLKVVNTLMASR